MSGQSVGGDIRLSIALKGHRKVKRLRRKLGGDGCWSLVCLWLFAGDQHWDGNLSGLSDDDLEEEAAWEGEPGLFVATLVELRLLTGGEGKRRIHDWAEHQPFAAQRGRRVEAARQAVSIRWERERERRAHAEQEAENRANAGDQPDLGMPDAYDPHTTRIPPAILPTQPNLTSTTKLQPDPSHACARETVAPEGFEPADAPRGTTPANPAVPLAVALNRAGFRCTAMNPKLVAYAEAGGTVDHLLQVASLPECEGKNAGYVAAFALREATEPRALSTALIVNGSPRATQRTPSKTATGMRALENLKHGR